MNLIKELVMPLLLGETSKKRLKEDDLVPAFVHLCTDHICSNPGGGVWGRTGLWALGGLKWSNKNVL